MASILFVHKLGILEFILFGIKLPSRVQMYTWLLKTLKIKVQFSAFVEKFVKALKNPENLKRLQDYLSFNRSEKKTKKIPFPTKLECEKISCLHSTRKQNHIRRCMLSSCRLNMNSRARYSLIKWHAKLYQRKYRGVVRHQAFESTKPRSLNYTISAHNAQNAIETDGSISARYYTHE